MFLELISLSPIQAIAGAWLGSYTVLVTQSKTKSNKLDSPYGPDRNHNCFGIGRERAHFEAHPYQMEWEIIKFNKSTKGFQHFCLVNKLL